jgi:hypothetical protein
MPSWRNFQVGESKRVDQSLQPPAVSTVEANIFWDEYDKTVGGNVASYLPLGDSEGYTKRDDAWINIILSRNEPISAVEDSVL